MVPLIAVGREKVWSLTPTSEGSSVFPVWGAGGDDANTGGKEVGSRIGFWVIVRATVEFFHGRKKVLNVTFIAIVYYFVCHPKS